MHGNSGLFLGGERKEADEMKGVSSPLPLNHGCTSCSFQVYLFFFSPDGVIDDKYRGLVPPHSL